MLPTRTIRVLIVEPGKAPYPAEIPTGLSSLQQQVGGLIQALYPFEDPFAAVIANDEGKLLGLPWNRPLFDDEGEIYDILVGKRVGKTNAIVRAERNAGYGCYFFRF